eukprot:838067-Lingulodinium_polyedra.AAC.1
MGSSGYAAGWFLRHKLQGRIFQIHDIFHREWNDVIGALKSSGLWWTVLLSTVVYNLCFGPWGGSAWYQKIKSAAGEYFSKEAPGNPLFAS